MHLSSFSPFGIFQFRSDRAYPDLISEQAGKFFEGKAQGEYLEAKIYAWSILCGLALSKMDAAGKELYPELSFFALKDYLRDLGLSFTGEVFGSQAEAKLLLSSLFGTYDLVLHNGLRRILGDSFWKIKRFPPRFGKITSLVPAGVDAVFNISVALTVFPFGYVASDYVIPPGTYARVGTERLLVKTSAPGTFTADSSLPHQNEPVVFYGGHLETGLSNEVPEDLPPRFFQLAGTVFPGVQTFELFPFDELNDSSEIVNGMALFVENELIQVSVTGTVLTATFQNSHAAGAMVKYGALNQMISLSRRLWVVLRPGSTFTKAAEVNQFLGKYALACNEWEVVIPISETSFGSWAVSNALDSFPLGTYNLNGSDQYPIGA